MNLNDIAESDLEFTLEDSENGFGVNVILYDLNDNEYNATLQTTDIGFFIDLQSGVGVQSRQVEVHGRISTIETAAADLPCKNWRIDYVDTNGKTWSCSIVNVIPDRKLGIYRMILEGYNKNANL